MAKIEKLKSGNYTVRVVVGHDADGKPIRKRFTHYDKAKLRLMVAKYEDSHRARIRRQTVTEAIDAFLAAKSAVLSPSTIKDYNSRAVNLKADYAALCAKYVDDVTKEDLQMMINDMVADGKSPKTIANYRGFLSAAFSYADVRLPRASLPQAKRPNISIPETNEVKDLLSKAVGTRLEIPLALAAMGLRRSEICALSVDDLQGNILHIHRSAVYGTDKAVHIKTTKNYTSDRFVLLPKPLAAKIKASGIIWDGTPIALSDCFYKFITKHSAKKYRLHDMRHFFASYCHNVLKMSDKQIQAITGHKTAETLRRVYLHSLDQEKINRLVAKKMTNLIS